MIPIPASPFQDHAILQRDLDIPVWGRVAPFGAVEVALEGRAVARGLANAAGDFLLRLPPQPAGGPHRLAIRSLADGEETVLENILIGEVWLASGQSNMEWTLGQLGVTAEVDVQNTDLPELRMFTVARRASLGPQSEASGAWLPFAPDHNAGHSATSFYFARELHRRLGVPVGVILSAWGGSMIEAWTPRSVLAAYPPVRAWLLDAERASHAVERWPSGIPMLPPPPPISNLPHLPAVDEQYAAADFDDTAWPRMELPRTWQADGHLFSGVFWFRREVVLPAAWVGKDLRIGIGAVDKQDITYVNGVEIGRTGKDYENGYWNLRRHYTIPAELTRGGKLRMAIRAFSFQYDGGLIGPAEDMRVTCGNETLPLAGGWAYHIEHNFGLLVNEVRPGHGQHNSPYMLFDNMIRPLAPYGIRGALWYQGESNAARPEQYAPLLAGMIQAWRVHGEQGDFPFLIVQLPAYKEPLVYEAESTWARMREAQSEVARHVPHTHLTVNLDLGDSLDIHPRKKREVGERLAHLALAEIHGEGPTTGGPLPCGIQIEGDTVLVTFERVEGGLCTRDGGPVHTLFVADAEGVFLPAEAVLHGNELRARRPGLAEPKGIAYAWADHPQGANLTDAQGLPASPFRFVPNLGQGSPSTSSRKA